MLSLKAVITGLVSIACLSVPCRLANADGIDLPKLPLIAPAASSTAANETAPLVRIRLVEELKKPGSAASVSLAAGSDDLFIVEVRRSALSAQVLAAAFAARSDLVARRAKYPSANVVIYISDSASPRDLSPSDQLEFARLVTELQSRPPSGFVEVSGR